MTHKFRKETVSPQTFLCANYGLTFYLYTLLSLNSSVIPSNHFFFTSTTKQPPRCGTTDLFHFAFQEVF